MKKAAPSQLLAPSDGDEEPYWIDLGLGVFLSFYEREGEAAHGFWIEERSVPSLDRAIDRALKGVKTPRARLIVKLVGDAKAVDAAAAKLDAEAWAKVEARPRSGAQRIQFFPNNGRIRAAAAIEAAASAATPPPARKSRIRALIVDDSKTIRSILEKILSADPQIEIVGSVERPSEALNAITTKRPDVITLDIHMPEMDGVQLLKKYIVTHPIPTVMISSISMEESPMVLAALEAGAVDYIQKPSFEQISQIAPLIVEKVKTAAEAKVRRQVAARVRGNALSGKKSPLRDSPPIDHLVAIGSSTGGTEALRQLLTVLPAEIPPILIVQHIPPVFSTAFANRMNELCPFTVQEAKDGDRVRANQVLIAPGGTQMSLVRTGGDYFVRVDPQAGPVNRHKPSVDVLFDSVSTLIAKQALGVILTGMGADGAKGLLKMRQAGSATLGQDEASCVVYGMPQAAFKLGAVERQLPLSEMAQGIVDWAQRRGRKAA